MDRYKYNFAVIFDADGVLVDSNPFHKIAMRQFCEKYGIHLTEQKMKREIFGRTNKDWLSKIFKDDLTEQQLKKYEEEKESLFRKLFKPYIKPVNGLIGFLEQLKIHNITRAVASSAPKVNVDFFLSYTGVRPYFPVIIDGDEIEHSKPHPEIYLKTVEIIKFPPENCIVIEDSLSGVEAARTAGCKVIGITTTHSKEELHNTERIIDDFNELTLNHLQMMCQSKKL